MEVSYEEALKKGLTVYDIRNQSEKDYGTITGAVNIDCDEILSNTPFSKEQGIAICCTKGIKSKETAKELRERGYNAFSIKGGFQGWLKWEISRQQDEDICEKAERCLRKKFKPQLLARFLKAVKQYELIKDGDSIAVCISGGKDSMLMAKLFQELKRHSKIDFDVKYLVMDPGYNDINRRLIEENAKKLNIPINIFESNIFDSVYTIEKSPCYLCARMRRGYLYDHAKKLGCNKIALGHHYDDVIETVLMGMLHGAQIQTMMPKLHSVNFEGMELIRPMYFIREDDIKAWRDYNGLHFLQCACRFTEDRTLSEDGVGKSKRQEIKQLIKELKKTNPNVEQCIFRSMENVNVDTVLEYKKNGIRHNFLDEYDK